MGKDKRGRDLTAGDLGIRSVTHTLARVEIMPKGGFKTAKDRTVSVSLPRVTFLEIEIPSSPSPVKKNRGGRPRKRPAI